MVELILADDFRFEDLYETEGLSRLDQAFLSNLAAGDAAGNVGDDSGLAERLEAARRAPEALDRKAESALLLELAGPLDAFIGRLFGIETQLHALAFRQDALAPLYSVKRLFVQRRAGKQVKPEAAAALDGGALARRLAAWGVPPGDESAFANHVAGWMADETAFAEELSVARDYAAWALHSAEGRARHKDGVVFKQPAKLDPHHLLPLETRKVGGRRAGLGAGLDAGLGAGLGAGLDAGLDGGRSSEVTALVFPEGHLRRREGFALTDHGMDLNKALDQANYCILCHHQGKDSCSTGLKDRDGAFRKSAFGVTLAGCPLEEKISEMHEAKRDGLALAALAIVAIDNPMAAGTGHRICNDCMKACIYQKQEPVDIPQAETRILKDVLELPWGFEIYGLLTRWNPLNLRRPLPRPDSGRKVLVAGLGPAGYTLAHYLLNDGHTVAAIDGLKIEPLAPEISGVRPDGSRVAFEPILDLAELREPLDGRVMAGFGGVAEYGITVRWDKTFLKVIRLLLERRTRFAMYGGVRLGGTITMEQAFEMGFDHVALALGAGKPTILDLPNGLAPGVRMASDFLMALQLTGAAKADSVANLQLRLPVVVIGGGLTAIDTATEAMAYYPVQVEKFLARYETLMAERGLTAVRARWTGYEAGVADEFLAHARALRAERRAAAAEGRPPRLRELIRSWGGVTIAYRRRLIDSPSYTLNHEEVGKAFEEGIAFAEGLTPVAVEVDAGGWAEAMRFRRRQGPGENTGEDAGGDEAGGEIGGEIGDEVVLPARAILVAAGTRPNTVLAREEPASVTLDGRYFQAVDEEGRPVTPQRSPKPDQPRVLMSRREDGRTVSFFGDLHPSYAGNVVKAMASAKQGWPVVSASLARLEAPASAGSAAGFIADLDRDLRPVVHAVRRLTPTIVEVVARAPAAARGFHPGQFYRLQNYEALAPRVADTRLAMEGLAMTGAWVDLEAGLIGTIVLEMGGSSDLCTLLEPGEPLVLMGPTGTPTEIAGGETVLLAGGGLGNAVLFSIGRALRDAGSRVLYFAGYRQVQDRYKVAEIEAAGDVLVWACDEAPGFAPGRPQDLSNVGSIVETMVAYQKGALGERPIGLEEVERIIAIGSQPMMAAVGRARHGVLASWLKPGHRAIGSINSPMQCMMKEICAQCLQTHRDPQTGKVSVVFSCASQDQPLDLVDFDALAERLVQNGVLEKLTAHWIDRCLKLLKVRQAA